MFKQKLIAEMGQDKYNEKRDLLKKI